MDQQLSVVDEIHHLRQTHPGVKIQAATSEFLTASYERTIYTRVKVTLTFPSGYPDRALLVSVDKDKVVPPGLKRKLETELTDVVLPLVGTHDQVDAVFGRLINFIQTNKFVPCWRELKQCADLVQGNKSVIQINDTKGLIQLRLKAEHGYYYACSIAINDGYPSSTDGQAPACKLTLNSTSFPAKIKTMLTIQARELVRRMQQDGMTADRALRMSNPIKAPTVEDKKQEPQVRLTQATLKGLKRDTETLKRVSELRGINAATVQGNATIKAHKAKERKDARRTINKITESERKKDQAEWQQQEEARLAQYNLQQYDEYGTEPQPSLLSLVTFLITKIQKLPQETCPACQKPSLPSNPELLLKMYTPLKEARNDTEKKSIKQLRPQRPTRTYCGCWYHYECLSKIMTEPPFGESCPAHPQQRVHHPDFADDPKGLERAWANKQARLREIEDAKLFL